jgi:hypothetical protein
MWGSGASGAFVGDTISLVVFYRDAEGDPFGPRLPVTWTSSRPAVVSLVSESLAVALDTGRVVLTATARSGPPHTVAVPFEIIPPWQGHLIWSRGTVGTDPRAHLAVRTLPGLIVTQLPDFGFPGASKGDPYLSHDGSKVAAIANRPWSSIADRTIYVVDVATGSTEAPFESLPGNQFAPVWMPGDSLIAFLMEGPRGYEVFTGRPDGTGVQRRTDLGQFVPPFFDVTPDRHLIIPLRDLGGSGDLYELTLAGDTIRRLWSPAGAETHVPAASSDGTMIAFSDGAAVWIMNRDGSDPRRLFPARKTRINNGGAAQYALSGAPSWTPDSRFVLFYWTIDPLVRPDGQVYNADLELYAVRVADGLAIRLTRSAMIDTQPVFR